jgi:two-component system OmpR family sensor kinase
MLEREQGEQMASHCAQRRRQTRPRLALPSLPTPVALAGEALAVLCAAVVAAVLLHAVVAAGAHPLQGQAGALLASATAGAAAVVALLCALSARLRDEAGMRLTGYAWAFYGLVVVPLGVLDPATGADSLLPGATAATAAIFLVLLTLSFARRRPARLSGLRALAAGLALTALLVAAAAVLPAQLARVLDSKVTDAVLLAGWGLLACGFVTRGLRCGAPVWWRTGFGLVLIAAAHTLLLAGGTATGFAVLRFIGFLVLIAALCGRTRTLVRERRAAEAQAAERAAAEEHARATQRHEVRNALATLSSVTTLMTPRPEAAAATAGSIPAMIDAELARLRGLIEDTAPAGDTGTAALDPVLARLVTLRRAAGARITLECPPGLVAGLPTATLAQVVTNLLANCARHAEGAEVYVGARQGGAGYVVEVTDAGAGLGARAGVSPRTGDGLGLALSAQLVEAAGGSLELRPTSRFPSGTTALLHLPPATGTSRHLTAVPTGRRAAS